MKKILSTLVFSTLVLSPFLLSIQNSSELLNWEMCLLVFCIAGMLFSQPNMTPTVTEKSKDKNSGIIIIVGSMFCVLFSVLEYTLTDQRSLYISIIGISIALFGLVFRIVAIKQLASNFSAIIKNPEYLYTDGLYKYIQHPSYTGSFIFFIGISVWLGQGFSILLTLIVLSYAYYVRIKYENENLLKAFPNEANEYQKNVKRLIPFMY